MVLGKSKILIGLQYGDEGKARVLDTMLKDYQIVARFNGGSNAGHTLEVGGAKIALHQVPSGIFYPGMLLYVGSGCVINPIKLNNEISEIESLGVVKTDYGEVNLKNVRKRLYVSSSCSLIQPHHILLDKFTGKALGTTNNGIGPAYADQAIRAVGETIHSMHLKNISLGEYLSNPDLVQHVKYSLEEVLYLLEKTDPSIYKNFSIFTLMTNFDKNTQQLAENLCSDSLFLERKIREGNNVFFEGAQSVMLDRVKGTVPFVTSSNTLAGAAYTGGDLSLVHHSGTVGVAKAITSRVGNGPFIGEYGGERSEQYCLEEEGLLHNQEFEKNNFDPYECLKSTDLFNMGIALRMLSGEYGATTKRPRRIGMLDLVLLNQNCKLNGVDELYINKFDCLTDLSKSSLEGIPLVTAYSLNGKEIDYVPSTIKECRDAEPIITFLPHQTEVLTEIRNERDLPSSTKRVIKTIEEYCSVKIKGIGVGPKREQFVFLS